jgi:hypothetical protein
MSVTARLTALAVVSLGAASGAAPAFADAHQSLINAPIIGPLETMGTYAMIDQAQQNVSGDLGAVLPGQATAPLSLAALLGADSPLVNLHHEPAGATVGDGLQDTSPDD